MNEIQRKAHKEAIKALEDRMSTKEKFQEFLKELEAMTPEEFEQDFRFVTGRLWEDDEQS